MKVLLAITALVFSVSVCAGLLSDKDVKWEPIIGHNHPYIKAFFDRNSLSSSDTDVGKVSIGNVLIANDKIIDVPINGTTLKIQSIVRMTMMNCNSGITIPIAEFYFDKKFPTNNDKPVKIIMFDGVTGTEISDKKSILYKLLCPEYI